MSREKKRTGKRVKASVKPADERGVSSVADQPHAEVAAPEAATDAAIFPVVGIGASAGGLKAFEEFLSGMPADVDPGMAFVLVQHLAPDHKSLLTELVRRYTRMEVFEVEDGMVVQPNCTYIIPPNHDMALLKGRLQLLAPAEPRGRRLPIDFFFRSLAQDQQERAICIVLSGTGSDGTLGVRAVKGEGGMAMAQSWDSTEHDAMPRSAVATGLVDYELPPREMPVKLMEYAAHALGSPPRASADFVQDAANTLRKVCILLRSQTGHDFSQYKPSTLNRRIARRMAVHQIDTMEAYIGYLRQSPMEGDALFRDLLIGVTMFFRDPDVFCELEKEGIPSLFARKPSGGPVRVWVAGCSTGEEAYSLAILLQEQMESLKQTFTLQIFATDIDGRAIATARAGLYPASIAADVSPERLARFFVLDPDGSAYRIHKAIRDMVVFSEQDVIKDPPFSRLDLISCRNLMIYMGSELQRRLIPLFHYAINPGGLLFLGTSETVGDAGDLFAALDRTAKLYMRRDGLGGIQRFPIGPILPRTERGSRPVPPGTELAGRSRRLPSTQGPGLQELTECALLESVVRAGVLVNEKGDILYVHGRTGLYLEPEPGETGVSNAIKMAREGLSCELAMALHRAVQSKDRVRAQGLRVRTNGHFSTINLTVVPVMSGDVALQAAPLFLVVFEELPETESMPAVAGEGGPDEADATIAALRQELRAKEEYLQASNEELETSNEELRSSNEEMQSINEELQSSNEELETSKEELQSVNEELATVNAELQAKVTDLSQANNDMNNLLAGTGIGTIFVDQQLRILRFTPAVTRIINLIPADVGRPVSDIVPNLIDYTALSADTQEVLDSLISKELEVQTSAEQWYTLQIRPYRTLNNVIEGAVITFVDIADRKRMQEELDQAEGAFRLARVVRDAHDAVLVQDLDGYVTAWNRAAERLYGWSEAEALQMNVRQLIPEAIREESLAKVRQLGRAELLAPYRTQRIAKDAHLIDVWAIATALLDETGRMYAISTLERPFEEESARGLSGGRHVGDGH